jgi:hypothetical protein
MSTQLLRDTIQHLVYNMRDNRLYVPPLLSLLDVDTKRALHTAILAKDSRSHIAVPMIVVTSVSRPWPKPHFDTNPVLNLKLAKELVISTLYKTSCIIC